MNLWFHTDFLRAYAKAGGKGETLVAQLKEAEKWKNDEVVVSSEFVGDGDIELLLKVAGKNPEYRDHWKKRRTIRMLRALSRIKGKKEKPTVNVEVMVEALRQLLKGNARHTVYTDDANNFVPWFVTKVKYNPANTSRGHYYPANGQIFLQAKCRGEELTDTKSFRRGDLGNGLLAAQLLERLGLVLDNDELYAELQEALRAYAVCRKSVGAQYLATGRGKFGPYDDRDDRERARHNAGEEFVLDQDGGPSKVIIDDAVTYGPDGNGNDEAVYTDARFWTTGRDPDDLDDQVEANSPVAAPVQPYLCVFSLAANDYMVVHVANLRPYEYNRRLGEKLVIPAGHRALIDVLLGGPGDRHQDIVEGKQGGTIILCSGPPGTGKTLTAEVYADAVGRPLYTMHCSQLGVDAQNLESQLHLVLRRSSRWGAILLADEADVYIQERGDDINQSAVVGVFLRLLEYHPGTVFLTTNRDAAVDDAIRSRCIAHIRYEVPTVAGDKVAIWRILLAQYEIRCTDPEVKELARRFTVCGRSIKQLCRLVSSLGEHDRGWGETLVERFVRLAVYQDLEDRGGGEIG